MKNYNMISGNLRSLLKCGVFLMLGFSLFACGDDDENNESSVPVEDTSTYPVDVFAERFNYQSEFGDSWASGDNIGLYLVDGNSGKVVGSYSNLCYSSADPKNVNHFLAAENEVGALLPASGDSCDVVAYYPFQPEMSGNEIAVNVKSRQEQAARLVAGRAEGLHKANRLAQLSMTHPLVQLQFKIFPEKGFQVDDFQGVEVLLKGLPTAASFNVMTSEVSGMTDVADFALPQVSDEDVAEEGGALVLGTVLPAGSTENFVAEVRLVSGKIYSFPIADKVNAFKSSYKYKFDCRITNDDMIVTVTSAPINPWVDDEEEIKGSGESK